MVWSFKSEKQAGKDKRDVGTAKLIPVADWRPFGSQLPRGESPTGDQDPGAGLSYFHPREDP